MKLIPLVSLAAGLLITGSSLTLAADQSVSSQGGTDSYNNRYNSVDKSCRFFDKIVFKITDSSSRYYNKYFDVKTVDRSLKGIDDLSYEVERACRKYPTAPYNDTDSSDSSTNSSPYYPCKEISEHNYEITFVDFAVACATKKY